VPCVACRDSCEPQAPLAGVAASAMLWSAHRWRVRPGTLSRRIGTGSRAVLLEPKATVDAVSLGYHRMLGFLQVDRILFSHRLLPCIAWTSPLSQSDASERTVPTGPVLYTCVVAWLHDLAIPALASVPMISTPLGGADLMGRDVFYIMGSIRACVRSDFVVDNCLTTSGRSG
jgi:hypothetical protein